MGGVSNEKGAGSSKLNTELNVVPFIDLLSSLVLFLLLSVVWVQIGSIESRVDSRGKSTVSMTDQSQLLVHVTRRGYRLTWPDKFPRSGLPAFVGSPARLSALLTHLVKTGKKTPAAISGDDSVQYGQVIQALDTVKSSGIGMVALSTD